VFDGEQDFDATSPFPLAGSAQHRAPSVTMRRDFDPTKTCTSCKRKNLTAVRDFDPDRKTCRACLRTQRRRHALKVRAELNRALAATGDATRPIAAAGAMRRRRRRPRATRSTQTRRRSTR